MDGQARGYYSRFVAWTKIILPLSALAILSSLFLFSKSRDLTRGISLLNGSLAEFATRERISSPRYAGTTPEGIALILAADEAKPHGAGGRSFDAENLQARVELKNGNRIEIIASSGTLDSQTRTATLANGVKLTTTDGYVARTLGLDYALERLDIRSHGEVTATGPVGSLRAGGMNVSATKGHGRDRNGYLIVFTGGVKLVYTPPKKD